MKVNIFKKLIKDIIREELDLKFAALDKKLDEVLVNKNNSYIVEDRAPQHNVSSPKKETQVSANTHIPLTKNSILNDILQETAHAGDWKAINKANKKRKVPIKNTFEIKNQNFSSIWIYIETKTPFNMRGIVN